MDMELRVNASIKLVRSECLQDVIKLGNSSREYVLLHEGSLNA